MSNTPEDDRNDDRNDFDSPDDTKAVVAAQLMRLQGLLGRLDRRRFTRPGAWSDPRRGQGRVLSILNLKPVISQRELTYLLDMSKQSLAELLSKLEKAGLIERTPSDDDRRVTMVRLTAAGQAAGQFDDAAPTYADEVLSVLDSDELATLSGYLARLIESLEQTIGADDIDDRRAMMMEFQRRHGGGRKHARDALDPRLIGMDPRMYPGFGPDPRFGPPDPRFGPPVPPDPRFGPAPDPRFGPGPDPRFGPGPDPRFGPGPDRGPRGRGRYRGGCADRPGWDD